MSFSFFPGFFNWYIVGGKVQLVETSCPTLCSDTLDVLSTFMLLVGLKFGCFMLLVGVKGGRGYRMGAYLIMGFNPIIVKIKKVL